MSLPPLGRIAPARQILTVALIVTLWAAVSAEPAAAAMRGMETLRISPLRIMCIKAPCPPWDAMAISQGPTPAGPHPLYLGPLPSVIGTKADRTLIARVWREKGWAFKVVSQGADLGSVNFNASIEGLRIRPDQSRS